MIHALATCSACTSVSHILRCMSQFFSLLCMTEERDRDPERLVSTLQQSASKGRNEPANNNNDNDKDKDNDNDDENDI